jgi:hypothetical protein
MVRRGTDHPTASDADAFNCSRAASASSTAIGAGRRRHCTAPSIGTIIFDALRRSASHPAFDQRLQPASGTGGGETGQNAADSSDVENVPEVHGCNSPAVAAVVDFLPVARRSIAVRVSASRGGASGDGC